MYNSISYLCLVQCIFFLSRTSHPLPLADQEIPEQPKDVSNIIAPGSSALEENGNDPPVYIMVPVVGERSRRNTEDGNVVSLDNVSYEIPTFIKFNESSKGDVDLNLIPNSGKNIQPAAPKPASSFGFGGSGTPPSNNNNNNNYCPPMNNINNNKPMSPICLTLTLDSVFPPGKKIAITNSSEIKGTGCILRVKFAEAKFTDECKPTTCPPGDFLGAALDQGLRQRLDTQKKRKFDDEEEEDDSATTQIIDQKTLQELIFKILTSNKTPSSTSPTEEVVFFENISTEPTYSFLINPSILQRISGKQSTTATRRITTLKSQYSPDFDSLLKTVEHITSTMPKEKLLSLLSSLINKAALNNEMSTNQ